MSIWIVLSCLLVVSLMISALALWIAARICRVRRIGIARPAVFALAVHLIGLAVLYGDLPMDHLVWVAIFLVVVAGVSICCIAWLLKTSAKRAALIWVLAMIFGNALSWPLALTVRATAIETFSVAGQSMGPTLLGQRWECTCHGCRDVFTSSQVEQGRVAVCPNCHQSQTAIACNVRPGDKFLVDKLARPGRWDIVVIRSPFDDDSNFVVRLVGLPGETIEIADGQILIDGKVQPKPPGLEVNYQPSPNDALFPPAGPVALGEDEYYLLGDNQKAGSDSRLWGNRGRARDGAIPGELIIGVVRLVYFPQSRWRIL